MLKAFIAIAVSFIALMPQRTFGAQPGILLLAHGGNAEWNARVVELAKTVDQVQPAEVAFGMATRRTIQAAVDRLAARGVSEIVAVPLFVSSWSSLVTSTEYLLGLRMEPPSELALYAGMDHGEPDSASHAEHQGDSKETAMTPVVVKTPVIRMSPALNAHRIVADILITRARSISRNPAEESVVIAAHGPVSDEENALWLADMRSLADAMRHAENFASIDFMTVRDDAPEAIRNAATAELRNLVSGRIAEHRRVLIVPLLLSFGGIEDGVAKRLDGLPYTMAPAALMPDDRLVEWVLEMANDTTGAAPAPAGAR